jgi:peroxiredoxin
MFFLVLLLLPVVQGCDDTGQEAKIKEPAPDFALKLLDGSSFPLQDHKGHAVVVNFFASWCVPCKEEAPALESVFQDYRDKDVQIVGVAVQDTESKARAFVEEHGLTFPTGLDAAGKIKQAYRVFGVPTTYFIDREGRITYTHAGAVTTELLEHELDKTLRP